MPPYIFFILLIITGVITSKVDFAHRQIKNQHLIIIAFAGLFVYLFTFITQKTIPTLQLSNLCVAIVIGILCYLKNLWRAGDAKLFILYSFLMPATGYEQTIPLPCIILFANTFLIGLICIIPDLAISLINNYKNISSKVFVKPSLLTISKSCLLTLSFSWMLFPLLTKLKIPQYGFISFSMIYILNYFFYAAIRNAYKCLPWIFPVILIASGLILHIVFDPSFFIGTKSLLYLATIFIYAYLFTILDATEKFWKLAKDRLPFSPFLFTGCFLSYSPFLIWITQHISRH